MKVLCTLKWAMCAIVLALFASSCVEDVTDGNLGGLPTDISFDLVIPAPEELTVETKATDQQETNVENIALLFYSSPGARPVVVEVSTMGTPTVVNSTNYIYTIHVNDDALVSGDYYLYAIGNYNRKGFGSVDLSKVRSMNLTQMKQYLVQKQNSLLDMNENALLLTGKFGRGDGAVTIKAGIGENEFGGKGEDYRIHLRRMTSKVSFSFVNGSGVTFTPTSYTIHNYPLSATLFERSGWQTKAGATDNVNGTFPGELPYAGDNLKDITANISGKSFLFYMLENVGQPKNTGLTYLGREAHSADGMSSADQTFYNAPDNSTYVTVEGHYSGPGAKQNAAGEWVADTDNKVTGNVSYTIHLGDFSTKTGSFDNFTVRRNAKYNYIVTVNGVKNIIVEAITNEEVQPGAEGNLLSTTTGTTNITLDSHYETVMVAIPAASYNSYILRVDTPLNQGYDYSVVDGVASGTKPTDVDWIKFAKPKSKTEFNAYPGKDSNKLLNIYELFEKIKEFNGASTDYYVYDSATNKIYVAAYVNEFFYEGKDLSTFINVAPREMTWATGMNMSTDKKSSYADDPIFSIKQKSIKTMYSLSVANPFGIESVEEFDSTFSMEDSGSGSANSMTKGWENFTSKFSTDGSASWTSYVQSTFGHYDNSSTIDKSYLVNKYGEYQCLSRNRDENGDGKIDAAEVKWYLPSHDECLTVWNGFPALDQTAQTRLDGSSYYSSTNAAAKARVWWADEGSAFGGNAHVSRVRCVRALNSYSGESTATFHYNNETRVVTMSGFGDGAVRKANSVSGEYVEHERNASADQLPEAFQIAKENCIEREIVTTATPVYVDGEESIEVAAPNIEFTNITVDKESHSGTGNKKNNTYYSGYTLTANVNVSNFNSAATYGYSGAASGSISSSGAKEITVTLTSVTTGNSNSYPSGSYTINFYPVVNGTAYNTGSYVTTVTLTRTGSSPNYEFTASVSKGTGTVTIKEQYLDHYEYSTTITAASGSTGTGSFTRAQVLASKYCQSSYYESTTKDKKGVPTDLGQWRTPNERELGIMMASVGTEKDSSPNEYALNVYTASKSYYDRSDTHCPYFIQNNAVPFITTANESYEFKIRCVRDATPETVTE